MNYFTFDGIDSRTYNTYIATSNAFDAPGREDEVIKVPGSNNIYYLTEGTYKPFDIKLYCYIPSNMQVKTDDLRNFLLSKGTCTYTEAIRPNEFRVARFIEAYELDVSDRVSAAFVLTFKAQPQRYLTTNTPITTTATADTTTDTTMSLSTVPTPINISLNGNTTQEGTPSPTNPQVIHNVSGDNTVNVLGKNLIKINEYTTRTHNGMTFKALNDGGVLVNGTTTGNAFFNLDYEQGKCPYPKGVPLTISGGAMIGSYALEIDVLINGSTSARATTSGVTFTIPTTATEAFTRVRVPNSGVTIDNVIVHPLLEVGSTATTYEPYTRQSYPLYLPVENLLSRRTTRTTNGVTFTVNADGTITTSGTATANIYNALAVLNLPNDTYTMTGSAKGGSTSTYYMYTEPHYRGDTGNGVTFTDSITSCSIFVASGQNMDGKVFKPQIEKGSKANHYTPYGTTPIELNKIGTYQDYIYKNGGKWYVHKAITKVDLGTLDSWNSYNNTFYANLVGAIIGPPSGIASILCTSYRATSMASVISKLEDKAIALNTGQSRCNVYDSSYNASTIGNFINSVKGVYLYYPLATPTNTEITDTTLINQLNNIEKAYSYNGTTNILQVSNDNGFMLGVVSLHANNVSSTYKGEPIITVNSTGLIYFNGCVIKVNQAPMTINSQTMQAYNGTVNLNNYIEADDFPMIEPGNNVIGSEMPLSIVPNYWKL